MALDKGFSLIEMLIVIAIIGVIGGVAIPLVSNFDEAAKKVKAKRNAQNLAAVSSQAMAVGVDFVGANSRAQAISNVIKGSTVLEGSFAGDYFGVPNLSDEEATIASVYLQLVGSKLQYHPDGGQTPILTWPPANN